MSTHWDSLLERISYNFQDLSLIRTALTHRSIGQLHYERLEFLGDNVLSLVVSHYLFEYFPESSEGELSRLKSHLVSRSGLLKVAEDLELSKYLFLGPSERGHAPKDSIVADVVESLLGAIFLDGGYARVSDVILKLFYPYFQELERGIEKDSKTRLQEYLQSAYHVLPEYIVIDTQGESHAKVFYVSCSIPGLTFKTVGSGKSRRVAEKNAATDMIQTLLEYKKTSEDNL